jgi:hypothetical protein
MTLGWAEGIGMNDNAAIDAAGLTARFWRRGCCRCS